MRAKNKQILFSSWRFIVKEITAMIVSIAMITKSFTHLINALLRLLSVYSFLLAFVFTNIWTFFNSCFIFVISWCIKKSFQLLIYFITFITVQVGKQNVLKIRDKYFLWKQANVFVHLNNFHNKIIMQN